MNKIKKYNNKFMTFIFFWGALTVLCSLYLSIPMVNIFANYFETDQKTIVWIGSVFSMCFALGCFIFGPISDKYGRKSVIILGLIALCVLSFLLSRAETYNSVLILRALSGFFAGTFSPVALAFAQEVFPQEKRITVISYMSIGFLSAGVIGQLLASIITASYHWHYLFLSLSFIYLISSLLFFFFIPNLEANGKSILKSFQQIKLFSQRKSLIFAFICSFSALMIFVSMYTVLGDLLKNNFGLSYKEIIYVRALGLIAIMFSPLINRLANIIGIVWCLRLGFLVSILGLVLMAFSKNLEVLSFMSVICVAGTTLSIPAIIAIVGQLGGEEKGTALSVYTFILFLGVSFGPLYSIYLIHLGGYSVALIGIAVIVFLTLISSLFIKL